MVIPGLFQLFNTSNADLSGAANGNVLTFNSASGKWKPAAAAGGGFTFVDLSASSPSISHAPALNTNTLYDFAADASSFGHRPQQMLVSYELTLSLPGSSAAFNGIEVANYDSTGLLEEWVSDTYPTFNTTAGALSWTASRTAILGPHVAFDGTTTYKLYWEINGASVTVTALDITILGFWY